MLFHWVLYWPYLSLSCPWFLSHFLIKDIFWSVNLKTWWVDRPCIFDFWHLTFGLGGGWWFSVWSSVPHPRIGISAWEQSHTSPKRKYFLKIQILYKRTLKSLKYCISFQFSINFQNLDILFLYFRVLSPGEIKTAYCFSFLHNWFVIRHRWQENNKMLNYDERTNA